MMTDPIADMLTRIRNALIARKGVVEVKHSKVNLGIARVLRDEGYIQDFKVVETEPRATIRVYLKYGPDEEMIITEIQRSSKPSRRVYRGVDDIPRVRNGLGIAIVSTSKGLATGRKCEELGVGGEVVCYVW
jgi:small subunit ribosomal protein S8